MDTENLIFNQLKDHTRLCPGQLSANLFIGIKEVLDTLYKMKDKKIVEVKDENLEELLRSENIKEEYIENFKKLENVEELSRSWKLVY